jgi:hypothetical protein
MILMLVIRLVLIGRISASIVWTARAGSRRRGGTQPGPATSIIPHFRNDEVPITGRKLFCGVAAAGR